MTIENMNNVLETIVVYVSAKYRHREYAKKTVFNI